VLYVTEYDPWHDDEWSRGRIRRLECTAADGDGCGGWAASNGGGWEVSTIRLAACHGVPGAASAGLVRTVGAGGDDPVPVRPLGNPVGVVQHAGDLFVPCMVDHCVVRLSLRSGRARRHAAAERRLAFGGLLHSRLGGGATAAAGAVAGGWLCWGSDGESELCILIAQHLLV
jgi:hypothetical protein